jgi:hypothetical protein
MNARTKTGLEILQVAVGIGILGDILLRSVPWGLNVLLFNTAFAVGAIVLMKRREPSMLTAQTLSLFGALVFFAGMFVWRDSIELRTADTFAILAILAVLFVSRMNVPARLAGVLHYGVGFVWAAVSAFVAPFLLVGRDIEWSEASGAGWRKHAVSVLRGVAIATPLILIFGGLFVAADAAYEGLVRRVFYIEPETVFLHLLLFGAFAWMAAGYFQGLIIGTGNGVRAAALEIFTDAAADAATADQSDDGSVRLPHDRTAVEHINISDPPNDPQGSGAETTAAEQAPEEWSWANIHNGMLPAGFRLGAVEIGIVLGLMNLLFLSFVVVQVPYLFGGMELVQTTPDFKLADYARRGFGELVAVSALVLPLLLASHWLIRREERFALNLYRMLAATQIVLLFVVMASAVQRLVLLTGNLGYGMTTIRLYPLIFMVWLSIVFIWFAVTVLRGSRQYFAWGALWSAIVMLGATHVLNPDEFIVKTNLALMHQGREFDAYYNSRLSDDALPAVYNALPAMNAADQRTVILNIGARYCFAKDEIDLRSFNLSRHRVLSMVASNVELVNQLDCAHARFARPETED